MVDFLIMLCENAKIYKYHNLKNLLPEIYGQKISIESASRILDPYIKKIEEVEKDQEIIGRIYKQLEEYKKILFESLSNNSHINEYDGNPIMNENNADAILIDFVNFLSSVSQVDIIFHL